MRALEELEGLLRAVSEDLTGWRARALRAEGSSGRPDPELRNRIADLESENKTLRQRVDAARARVHEMLGRLTFLEEQAREAGNGRGAAGGGTR